MSAVLHQLLSIDQLVSAWVATYGPWAIGLVALIVLFETGVVVAPFLPGDSLLFVTGTALAAAGRNVHLAVAVLVLAAVCGDALNFAIGRNGTQWLLRHTKWLRPDHVRLTERYFARYGALTIVVARFVPIVRTIAPFLAGAGDMPYARFALFNVAGGTVWVAALVYAGALLGRQPFVRDHLTAAALAIVAVSLLPLAVAAVRARLARLRRD